MARGRGREEGSLRFHRREKKNLGLYKCSTKEGTTTTEESKEERRKKGEEGTKGLAEG